MTIDKFPNPKFAPNVICMMHTSLYYMNDPLRDTDIILILVSESSYITNRRLRLLEYHNIARFIGNKWTIKE